MTALFSDQFAPHPLAPVSGKRIWLHDIGNNRLYADRRLIVHFPAGSSHDRVARQCRF